MLTLQNVCIDLHKNTCLNLPWQATELFWHWIITVLELRARGMEDVCLLLVLLWSCYLFTCLIGQSDHGWVCAFHFYDIPRSRLSHCPDLRNLTYQSPKQTKNPHPISYFMVQLHRVLALICSWGGQQWDQAEEF